MLRWGWPQKGRGPPSQREGLTGGEVTFPRPFPSCWVLTGILYAGHVSPFLTTTPAADSPRSVQMAHGRQGAQQGGRAKCQVTGSPRGAGQGPRSSAPTLLAAGQGAGSPSRHTRGARARLDGTQAASELRLRVLGPPRRAPRPLGTPRLGGEGAWPSARPTGQGGSRQSSFRGGRQPSQGPDGGREQLCSPQPRPGDPGGRFSAGGVPDQDRASPGGTLWSSQPRADGFLRN